MPKIKLSNGVIRYRTTPLYGGIKRINKEVAFNNLCLLKQVLDRDKIPFQLAYGTLLGAVREKDFIDYDEDIDLFVLGENKQKLFDALPDLIDSGFKIARYDRRGLLSIIKNKEYIDFYFYDKCTINGKGLRKCSGIVYPAFFFEQSTTILFKGVEFCVPAEYIFFLRCAYGKGWSTPIEYFNYEMPLYKKLLYRIRERIKECMPDCIFIYFAKKTEEKVTRRTLERLQKRLNEDEALAQLCEINGFN